MMLSLSIALLLRSTLLSVIEKSLRLVHACYAFIFSAITALLALHEKMGRSHWIILAALLTIFAIAIFLRRKRGSRHFALKTVAFMLFLLACSAELALSTYQRAQEEAPLVKVVMPGIKQDKGYLVQLFSVEGDLLGEYVLDGELVSLRAKVIRVKPFLSFLGFSNLCKIDAIAAGFMRPHACTHGEAYPLSHKRGIFFEELWEKIFFEKAHNLWINSALLQANFFPLVDRSGNTFSGSFFLTLTRSGLSSLAAQEEKTVR